MKYTNRHTGTTATAYQLTHHNADELAEITKAYRSCTQDGDPFLMLPKTHSLEPLAGNLIRLGEWAARPSPDHPWKGYPDMVFQILYTPAT